MASKTPPVPEQRDAHGGGEFARRAAARRQGLLREAWHWLRATRKWWLLPVLLSLLVVGFFLVVAASGAGPLLYTLF